METERLTLMQLKEKLIMLQAEADEARQKLHIFQKYFTPALRDKIRSPLSAIMGFSKLLLQDQVEPELKKLYADYLESSSENLVRSVDDLVDFIMLTLDKLSLERTWFRPAELLDDLYYDLKKQKRITERLSVGLFCHMPDDAKEMLIYSDRQRLGQAMDRISRILLERSVKGILEIGFNTAEEGQILFFARATRVKYIREKLLVQNPIKDNDPSGIESAFPGFHLIHSLIGMLGGELRQDPYEEEGISMYFVLPVQYRQTDHASDKTHIETDKELKYK